MLNALLAASIAWYPLPVAPLPQNIYRTDNVAVTIFVQEPNSEENCGVAPPGRQIFACVKFKNGVPVMIMPNPCKYRHESYARVACHELGHVNGWPGDHPNPKDD